MEVLADFFNLFNVSTVTNQNPMPDPTSGSRLAFSGHAHSTLADGGRSSHFWSEGFASSDSPRASVSLRNQPVAVQRARLPVMRPD
jgi:hypothetical protein